jgi:hypothetical protein
MAARMTRFLAFTLLATCSGAARALPIQVSNASHSVFNGITQSRVDEAFATFAVNEHDGSADGNVSLFHDLGYASALGEADGFSLNAEATVDGSDLLDLELDSVASDANATLNFDFVIGGATGEVFLHIDPLLVTSDVSTQPRPGFGQPGTSTERLRGIRIFQGGDVVFGANVLDDDRLTVPLVANTLYRFEVIISAVAGVRDSAGMAAATTHLDVGISASTTVPEPGATGSLSIGLAALAAARRRTGHASSR